MGEGVIVLDVDGVTENTEKGNKPDYKGQERICDYVQTGHFGKSPRVVLNSGRSMNYLEVAARNIGDPRVAIGEEGGILYEVWEDQITLIPTANAAQNTPTFDQIKRLLPDRVSFYPGKIVCTTVIPPGEMTVMQLYQRVCAALQRFQVNISYSKEAVNIMPLGTDKGTGLLYLIQLWKSFGIEIDLAQSIGIGDSQNDFSFFEILTVGGGKIGCPANAAQDCKDYIIKYGGYIATATFAGGTADILDLFFGKEPQQKVLTYLAAT